MKVVKAGKILEVKDVFFVFSGEVGVWCFFRVGGNLSYKELFSFCKLQDKTNIHLLQVPWSSGNSEDRKDQKQGKAISKKQIRK